MNKIIVKNAMFYGFHGVHEFEREIGQRFYYDIELICDEKKVIETDDLRYGIDYVAIYQKAKDIAENTRFKLLETLGYNMCKEFLVMHSSIKTATVRIRKLAVPITGPLDYIEMETTLDRDEQ